MPRRMRSMRRRLRRLRSMWRRLRSMRRGIERREPVCDEHHLLALPHGSGLREAAVDVHEHVNGDRADTQRQLAVRHIAASVFVHVYQYSK